MRRILISGPLAAMAALWLTSSALAGGFAITTLDPLPHTMQAGETYRIGYLIRQHGVTPVRDATPKIVISRGTERVTFVGIAEGGPGHYVSDVTFPTDGDWLWEVDQSPFPLPQSLGSIRVAPVPAPAVAEARVTIVEKPQPPAELALLGLVALAFAGAGVALRQMKRVARPVQLGSWSPGD
jgi:hypothetical protein